MITKTNTQLHSASSAVPSVASGQRQLNGVRPDSTGKREGVRLKRGIDLTGKIIGRLTVIKLTGKNKNGQLTWECKCTCGNKIVRTSCNLSRIGMQSCGCFNRENPPSLKHGFCSKKTRSSYPSEYKSWSGAKQRCLNPNDHAFKNYGGRGIKICDRWINSFENFLEDMGMCPNGFEIERKNNAGDYCPDNCRWASKMDQANNKRSTVFVKTESGLIPMAVAAREAGLPYHVVRQRLCKLHWDHSELFLPLWKRGQT